MTERGLRRRARIVPPARARVPAVLALTALTTAALAACVPLSPPPYSTPSPLEVTPSPASADGFRAGERIALRVWAIACESYRNGTAWMLDETHAVTNRHVVEDTTTVALTDYQGNEYAVTAAEISDEDDLALLTIDGAFPTRARLATEEPAVGDQVTVAGFALGGPLEARVGTYRGLRENELDPAGASIYFVEVFAQEGNSGSPLTNEAGEVVGVVFSSDGEDFAGAVTLPRLEAFLADDAPRTEVDASC